jgi:hypothetical protein
MTMKTTVIVMDVRFRLIAIAQSGQQTQALQIQVMCIQQVTDILISFGFLDSKAAVLLTEASAIITPQPGVTTVPFSDFAALTERVYPELEPVSLEAQQGHVLIAHGETTEEALASAGFVLKVDSGYGDSLPNRFNSSKRRTCPAYSSARNSIDASSSRHFFFLRIGLSLSN